MAKSKSQATSDANDEAIRNDGIRFPAPDPAALIRTKIILEMIEQRAHLALTAIEQRHWRDLSENLDRVRADTLRVTAPTWRDTAVARTRLVEALRFARTEPEAKVKLHSEPFITIDGTFDLVSLKERMLW